MSAFSSKLAPLKPKPEMPDYTISVEKMFKAKFGPKTPKLLISLGRKLLHEEWLNDFFRKGYTGVEFAEQTLKYLNVTINVEGLENLKKDGTIYTISGNHALGGIDAITMVAVFGRYFDGNIKCMVNDFLMNLHQLDGFMIAVNKVSHVQARELARETDEIFSSDSQIFMFPAGKVSRRIKGKIQDDVWTKTFLTKSVKFHRDIVPMHFYGRNTWRFYFVDWIGKVTGINKKFPLAMALLVDELYRAQGNTYKLVIGEPIPWSHFDNSRRPAEWAQWVREKVYEL